MSNFQPSRPSRQMSASELRLRQKLREKRRKQRQRRRLLLLVVIIIVLIGAVFLVGKLLNTSDKDKPSNAKDSSSQSISSSQSTSAQTDSSASADTSPQSQQTEQNGESSSQSQQMVDVSTTTNTNDWRMILANKNTPLPEGYSPELTTLKDSTLQMQTEAAEAFDQMREAANATGLNLMACSTYRSVERQTELFNAEIEKWKKQGMSQQQAEEKAATVVMIPGCSEHNTGLAVDVGSITNQRVEEDFEKEPEFAWLQQHAAEYGFILRYPKDKQAITGVTYEPWHYRYVGVENAKAIKESGLCLEEYLAGQS